MRRRGVGIGGLKKKQEERKQFADVGKQLEELNIDHIEKTLDDFRNTLIKFAKEHKADISADPEFRHQFHQMCKSINIDPLASSKGFWSILGVGDYYYQISVLIIDISFRTRAFDGGIMNIKKMLSLINNKRGWNNVSIEDIERSIEKLEVLGNGFRIISLGGNHTNNNNERYIISVPMELSNDHQMLMNICKDNGHVSLNYLLNDLKWTLERIEQSVNVLLTNGMIWVDSHNDNTNYYFSSFYM